MRSRWCILLLLVPAMAGCVGSDDGSVDDGPEGLQGESVPPETTGNIVGVVRSDAGFVIPDADAFLVGTEHETLSDAEGRYILAAVPEGEHTLRIESSGFLPHEATVSVVAGANTTVDATLLDQDALAPGFRPHAHDFWAGQETVRIADLQFDLATSSASTATGDILPVIDELAVTLQYANLVHSTLRHFVPIPDAEPPAMVYPGTSEIVVTFDWDTGGTMPPAYALGYSTPISTDVIALEAQPSGGTWTIPVAPEEADYGHQRFSLWSFYVVPVNDIRNAPDYAPAYVDSPVHITIDVTKGYDVVVDPPHPAFWVDGPEIVLLDPERDGDRARRSTAAQQMGGTYIFRPADEAIVPPGTGIVRIEYDWSYGATDGVLPDSEMTMWINTALQHPETPVAQWTPLDPVESDGSFAVYEYPLQPGDNDGYYQAQSAWRFAPRVAGSDPNDQSAQDPGRDRSGVITVTAIQETA